ncbi:MAG: SsrA-binding protein SmpB [Candidatus Pacebacteria bacterium]|nr:SsrA-binding protein SmpB [Candidatus Paceibacterota bacterium]
MSIYAVNKRAAFDYELLEKLEGGLVLAGHEVKAIKTGHLSLKGAFLTVHDNELYLTNAHIPAYQKANTPEKYDEYRARKVLVKRRELDSLIGKIKQKGLTLVPVKVYSKHRLIKLEFAVGKGKRKIDKREDIKKREANVSIRRALRGDKG